MALEVAGAGNFAFSDPEEGPEAGHSGGNSVHLGCLRRLPSGSKQDFKRWKSFGRLKRKTTEGDYDCQTRLSREPHGETDTVLGS